MSIVKRAWSSVVKVEERSSPTMSHFKIKNEEKKVQTIDLCEGGPSSEGDRSSDRQISDLKTKLLHHLVDVSTAVQKLSNDPEAEKLIQKNKRLLGELLDCPIKPAASEGSMTIVKNDLAVWNEFLMQKLHNAKVDLNDENVKELINKQVVDVLVRNASVQEFKDKVRFDTKLNPGQTGERTSVHAQDISKALDRTIHLRGIIFDIRLYSFPVDLNIYCSRLPPNMSCRATIEARIKNQAGKNDWIRTFSKVFVEKSQFTVNDLIRSEEYLDENMGLMKDRKMTFEVAIQADELVAVSEQSNFAPPIKRTRETKGRATKRKAV